MTVLLQAIFVLRAALYDNIRLGRPAASEAEVLAAARLAGLHDFVASLPSAYDTVVSDRDLSRAPALGWKTRVPG